MTMIILTMFRFNLFAYIFAYDDDDDLDRTFEALTGVTGDFYHHDNEDDIDYC